MSETVEIELFEVHKAPKAESVDCPVGWSERISLNSLT